ncbi:lycopene cyclase domain-containing protein [Sinomonas sp. ASV486]|uniref:lycopene cyclase domain-containing protein n=1 Tax=Sinomonas sp. ASV486 TaxID=3051170 RepID=UPI0027DC081A|nr:lycopene cyclase domain-containing protein [Sinomonas sp. ASV486]MDQ4491251.1 lycopene cyclase domain-containing protein [Sinomonas sp. ASV486]
MAYLTLLIAAAAGTAVLDARLHLAFWRDPRAAAVTVAAGTVFFLAWDLAAIAAGVFRHGSSPLMTGVMLGPELPLEEPVFLAFFSYTAVVLYAAAGRVVAAVARRTDAGGNR